MKTDASDFRTPLGRARGLGSARRGFSAWKNIRLSALALIPLTIWFVISVIAHLGSPLEELRAWIATPWTATLLILFVGIGAHHGAHGMTEVWDDYITHHWLKLAVDFATKALCGLLAVAMIVSVLKIAVLGA
jgi:succinate dehydrogenase / fumarate reductase membrane anchor subunit